MTAAVVLSVAAAGCSHTVREASSTGSDGEVVVPLRVVSNGRSTVEIVPVYINGQGPYDFMLDTGSSISSIDRRLASTLRLRRTGSTTEVRGVASTTTIPLVRIPDWRLGPARMGSETIGEIDLSNTVGGAIGGLLGSDQLRRFGAVTVDFQHGRLRLAHAQR